MELIPLSPLVSLFAALAEPLAGALAAIVGCTTLVGGMGHYGAVLTRKSKSKIEQMTGLGFFIGLAVGLAVVLLELT